jgi:hypothetical protein
VAILAVPSFLSGVNNTILLLGMGVICAGYGVHIFLNKKVE